MQDNATQDTGGKVQYCQRTQFQVHQLVHPDFFVEVAGIPITQTQKIDD